MSNIKKTIIILFVFIHALSIELIAQINVPRFKIYNKENFSTGLYLFAISDQLVMIDNFGTPVYYKKVTDGVLDFNFQKDGFLYYYIKKSKEFYKLDSSYQIVDTIKIKNELDLDYHEFVVRENGDIYLLGHNYMVMDLSVLVPGGQVYATVVEDVIQVLDKNKNIKLEWNSLDYIDILDTDTNFVNLKSSLVDYMHINSFDIDDQGDIYISSRHLNEITKIDGTTGEIIWRLGGTSNQFTAIGEEINFSGQHSVKLYPESKLLIFDNGNITHPGYSRGVEYRIDENAKTVEFLKEFRANPDVYASAMGNIQVDENDHMIVGWGKNDNSVMLTEFDSNDELILKIESPDQLYSYRAIKLNWKTNAFKSNLDTIDLGTIDYGETGFKNVLITNASDSVIELSSYTTIDTIFKVTNSFPITLQKNESAELTVAFSPSRLGGQLNDILTINSDGKDISGNDQRIAIQVKLTGFSPDIHSPLIETYPENNSTNIPVDTIFTIHFDESVRYIDDSGLTTEKIMNSVELRKNVSSEIIPYNLLYDSINNSITIEPFYPLDYNSQYVLTILPDFEDFSDNRSAEEIVYFITETATSISSTDYMDNDLFYPNPTSGKIKINGNELIDFIEIHNINGNKIWFVETFTILDSVIDISDKPAGIYMITIYLNDGTNRTGRILKL